MKALVKTGIFFVLVTLFIGSANAQPPRKGDRKGMKDNRIERMVDELNLTEEQQTKIKELNRLEMESMREEVQKDRQIEKERREAERTKREERMKANREKRDADMKSILTEEQYHKWTDKQKEFKQKEFKNEGRRDHKKHPGQKPDRKQHRKMNKEHKFSKE